MTASERIRELEAENRVLTLFHRVHREMAEASDVAGVCRVLLDVLQSETGAENGLVGQLDDEAGMLHVAARTGGHPQSAATGSDDLDLLGSPLRNQVREGPAVSPLKRTAGLFRGSRSRLVLPVIHRGEPIALAVMESAEEDRFAAADLERLEELLNQAGAIPRDPPLPGALPPAAGSTLGRRDPLRSPPGARP